MDLFFCDSFQENTFWNTLMWCDVAQKAAQNGRIKVSKIFTRYRQALNECGLMSLTNSTLIDPNFCTEDQAALS